MKPLLTMVESMLSISMKKAPVAWPPNGPWLGINLLCPVFRNLVILRVAERTEVVKAVMNKAVFMYIDFREVSLLRGLETEVFRTGFSYL